MTPSQFENSLLVQTVFKEAPKELILGQVAIAKVFKNRVAAGWHNGDLYKNLQVVAQNKPATWHATWPEGLNEPGFQALLQAVETIDSLPDMTDGALFYVAVDGDYSPYRESQRTGQVGGFLFFK